MSVVTPRTQRRHLVGRPTFVWTSFSCVAEIAESACDLPAIDTRTIEYLRITDAYDRHVNGSLHDKNTERMPMRNGSLELMIIGFQFDIQHPTHTNFFATMLFAITIVAEAQYWNPTHTSPKVLYNACSVAVLSSLRPHEAFRSFPCAPSRSVPVHRGCYSAFSDSMRCR